MVFGQVTSHNQNNETGLLLLTINTWKLLEIDVHIETKLTAGKTA